MNKLIFKGVVILLCAFSMNTYAQEFETSENDILGSGLLYEWCIWLRHKDGKSDYKYITNEQKKTINGISYYELRESLNKTYYCRYSDKKLYRYDSSENSEYVLFNFDLNPGDEFVMKDGRKMRVEEVSDTIFNDVQDEANKYGPFTLLRVVNVDDEEDQDIWIDGYGSMSTSVFSKDELGSDIEESLLLWTAEFPMINLFNTDYLKTQLMDIKNNCDNIDISPDTLYCEFENDTLVVFGSIYTGCGVNHYLSCEIQNGFINFSIQSLNSATCSKKYSFYARFSDFKEGQYTLKYRSWNGDVIEKNIICGNSKRKGDVNEDGVVDINDVVSVINIMANK